jgi:hypothetical protein
MSFQSKNGRKSQSLTNLAPSVTVGRYSNDSLGTSKVTLNLFDTAGQDRILNVILKGDDVIVSYGDVTPTSANMDYWLTDGFNGHISVDALVNEISIISTGSSFIRIIEK